MEITNFTIKKDLLTIYERGKGKKEKYKSTCTFTNLATVIDFWSSLFSFIIVILYLFNDKQETFFFLSSPGPLDRVHSTTIAAALS